MATTIEEQIERLKQRGMTIDDESAVKEALSDIGYYRLGSQGKYKIKAKREPSLALSFFF